jgi:hypothetical protein
VYSISWFVGCLRQHRSTLIFSYFISFRDLRCYIGIGEIGSSLIRRISSNWHLIRPFCLITIIINESFVVIVILRTNLLRWSVGWLGWCSIRICFIWWRLYWINNEIFNPLYSFKGFITGFLLTFILI